MDANSTSLVARQISTQIPSDGEYRLYDQAGGCEADPTLQTVYVSGFKKTASLNAVFVRNLSIISRRRLGGKFRT